MTADLTDTLQRLEAAKGDAGALALITADIVLESYEPKLARALEAAAVPHWFDEPLLRALLSDALPDAPNWFQQLTDLTVVERFQAHHAWNVHEVTRLALRQRAFARDPDWFRALSERAAAHIEPSSPLRVIERIYHLLVCAPEIAALQLREWSRQWRRGGELGSLQALATALEELCATEMLGQRSRAAAMVALGAIREERIGVRQLEHTAREAVDLMVSLDDPLGSLEAYTLLGRALRAGGRLGDAVAALQQGRALLERWAAQESNEMRVAEERATLHQSFGRTLSERGQLREALEEFQAGVRLLEGLRDREPHDRIRRRELAVAQTDVGDALLPTPQAAESEAYFSSALDVLQSSDNSAVGTDVNEYDIAQLKMRLGDVLATRANQDKALQQYDGAAAIFQRLAASDPDQLSWKAALACARIRIGTAHLLRGRLDMAEEHYTRARELYRSLTERDAGNPAWKQGLGDMSATFGALREAQLRWGDAAKEYIESERLLGELSQPDPDIVHLRMSHITARNALGRLLQKAAEGLEDAPDKITYLSRAVDQFIAARNGLNELTERDENNTAWQSSLAWTERLLGRALGLLADFKDAGVDVPLELSAADWRERALMSYVRGANILKTLADHEPQNTEHRRDFALTAAGAGAVLEKMGNRQEALAVYQTALRESQSLTALDETNQRWAEDVATIQDAVARLEGASSESDDTRAR